ncbi:MAG: aspartate 1-decarboxylase [Firmicutes bacterium]|nr:aspartate 1-decarboxylase [Bacillota bacterium]
MLRPMCKGKIHRATVTEADLNYIGSITIDLDLMEAAGILPYEMVQITNLSTGALWRTYVIAGERGSGAICLNGPPARLFHPGDKVIIISYAYFDEDELAELRPKIVFVDEHNRITEVRTDERPFELSPLP